MKKVLVIIGTRPECIKLAPLVMALRARPEQFSVSVCLTSQHKEMLQQALQWFPIEIDHDLNLMTDGQHQVQLQARILEHIKPVIDQVKPDLMVVQGDTSTAMTSAMAGCFHHVTVVHLEAGLRTFNRYAPWPEEINRLLISQMAEVHLAPTQANADQLRNEKVAGEIAVVGNTVVDALLSVRDNVYQNSAILTNIESQLARDGFNATEQRFILVTGHRRESFGDGMESICKALLQVAETFPAVKIVYAVHLNPQVKDVVNSMLSDCSNIVLLPPQEYGAFVYLMDKCFFILSDSGGIQEEAPSLNKPVLVMRETTERMEAVHAGAVKLVGTNTQTIVDSCTDLLNNEHSYNSMSSASNPFGDGNSSTLIADLLADLTLPSNNG